jgi:imidazoleglycerol phosphate dehydratase HisB
MGWSPERNNEKRANNPDLALIGLDESNREKIDYLNRFYIEFSSLTRRKSEKYMMKTAEIPTFCRSLTAYARICFHPILSECGLRSYRVDPSENG